MIVILATDDDATATHVMGILRSASTDCVLVSPTTLGKKVFVERNQYPVLRIPDREIAPSDISAIWIRRPIELGQASEDFLLAHHTLEWSEAVESVLLAVPEDRWINAPWRSSIAANKLLQLTHASADGFTCPKTLVTTSRKRLKVFWDECNNHVILKPLSIGYVRGQIESEDRIIYTNALQNIDDIHDVDLEACPTLFQERINKRFDIRTTVIDSSIISVQVTHTDSSGSQLLDFRRDQMAAAEYELIPTPAPVIRAITKTMARYSLRYAAFDFGLTADGGWVFFEFNPEGQWGWLDFDADAGIGRAFASSLATQP